MTHPEHIGRYRILGVLGRGGMGVVYRALETEPLEREVALKTVAIGLDSDAVLARFEHERQALARMSHPSVANVYDAGLTADGVPYFAMEYVEGTSLLEYCDGRRLGVEARLDLFLQVCSAVHHAHQKGVIHRDLKPGNVLVTEVDGAPLCKVIDFGIATAADPPDDERARLTGIDEVLGTPAYMSPEQIDGSGDVDTRTDVYALGIVMYELLAGVLPLSDDRYRGWAAYASALTEDAPTLSQRLSDLDDTQKTVAEARGLDAAALRRRLRGDLDWIVARSLEKNRDDRYASVQALAQDIERHLADEPVTAGPPGAAYRMRKFARRNRPLVIGAAAVLVVLLGGIASTTAGLLRARAAEADALTEAATAEQVSDFLIGLFQAGDPGSEGRSDVLAREILDRGVASIETDLADQPDVQGRILSTMALAYQGLSLRQTAADLAERALVARERALGPIHPALVEHLDLANELRTRASNNPRETARTDPVILERAERIREIGRIHEDDDLQLYIRSVGAWAYWMQARGRMDEAEVVLRADLERLGGRSVEVERRFLRLLGNMLMNDDQLARAVEAWEAEFDLLEDDDDEARATLVNNFALAYPYLGREDEAIEMLEANLERARTLADSDTDLRLHDALFNLAPSYREAERWPEAAEAYGQLAAVVDAAYGTTSPFLPDVLANQAMALMETGDLDAADSVAALAQQRIRPFLGDDRFGAEVEATGAMVSGLRVVLARRRGEAVDFGPIVASLPEEPEARVPAARSLGWTLTNMGAPEDGARVLDLADAAVLDMADADPGLSVDLIRDNYWTLAHQALESGDAGRLRDVAARWPVGMARVRGDGSGMHVLQARRESARVLALGDPFQGIPPIEATRADAMPVLEAIFADRRRDLGGADPGLLMHVAPLVLVADAIEDVAASAAWREEARSVVEAAVARLNADGVTDSMEWNAICWWGALAGVPEAVMPSCERAIDLASEENVSGHRDSRGLARALAGDAEGAIEDFQAYVEARPPGHETAGVRTAWIAELRRGSDPFTFFTLADIAM